MTPFYLMESEAESQRLLVKNYRDKTEQQLVKAGILSLDKNSKLVDAGCGVGHVAEVMDDLLRRSFKQPEIYMLDISRPRLSAAKSRLEADQNTDYHYITCDITRPIPLPSNSIDFVVCRFVFEYLNNQQAAFNELYRIVKPGGKLILGDLDYNCMTHYPLDHDLEQKLFSLVRTLEKGRLFDAHAGRKLYSFFERAQLDDIKVHFSDHHLFYGDLPESDDFNWTAKLDRLIDHQKNGTIHFDFDLIEFKNSFRDFLKSPGRFSYTPLILVEGRKPHGRK
ncbi:MAG TPA: class I SAM-dependent methyltransferase [bacterium]|jgi:ubiquinone/menaquinone biosynthesis C-methylase UbiE|nr:class I SAM-dependent methyltransferase [bacterium]